MITKERVLEHIAMNLAFARVYENNLSLPEGFRKAQASAFRSQAHGIIMMVKGTSEFPFSMDIEFHGLSVQINIVEALKDRKYWPEWHKEENNVRGS